MKLIEKMAFEYWRNLPTYGEDRETEMAFEAGFRAAREMAKDLANEHRLCDNHNGDLVLKWIFKNDIRNMGEEEVDLAPGVGTAPT